MSGSGHGEYSPEEGEGTGSAEATVAGVQSAGRSRGGGAGEMRVGPPREGFDSECAPLKGSQQGSEGVVC